MFKDLFHKGITLFILLLCISLGVSATSQAQSEDSQSDPNKIGKLTHAVNELEALVKALSLDLKNLGALSQNETEGLYPRLRATEAVLKKTNARLSQLESVHKKQSRSAQNVLKTQADITHHLATIDSQIKALQEAVATLALRQEKSQSAVLEVGNRLVDLSARSEQLESRITTLQDILTQISALQPVVASLQNQIQQLDTQINQQIASGQANVIQSQFNTLQTQVMDLHERLTALQSTLDSMQGKTVSAADKRIERLQEAVGQILIESQMNRLRINEIETKLTTLREELKLFPTAGEKDPPTQTTTSAILNDLAERLQATEQTAKEAKAAVDTAYTIALIALLAGIAGIVVGLIL